MSKFKVKRGLYLISHDINSCFWMWVWLGSSTNKFTAVLGHSPGSQRLPCTLCNWNISCLAFGRVVKWRVLASFAGHTVWCGTVICHLWMDGYIPHLLGAIFSIRHNGCICFSWCGIRESLRLSVAKGLCRQVWMTPQKCKVRERGSQRAAIVNRIWFRFEGSAFTRSNLAPAERC